MAAVLINGNGYKDVTAQRDADFYEGIFGTGTGVLNVGNKMSAAIVNNAVRIYDGVILTKEGRRIQIDSGEYQDIAIPAGTSGQTRYYIVGFKLVTNPDDTQTCETFARAVSSPSETIAEGAFRDGVSEVYISVYRVTQSSTVNALGEFLLEDIANLYKKTIYTKLSDMGLSDNDAYYINTIVSKMAENSVAYIESSALQSNDKPPANGMLMIVKGSASNQKIYSASYGSNPDYTYVAGQWEKMPYYADMYYATNSRTTLRLSTAGYITNGGTQIVVSAPTNKRLKSGRHLSLLPREGGIVVRQAGKYLLGTGSSQHDFETDLSVTFNVHDNEIIFYLTNNSGFGGINNDTVGVQGVVVMYEN